MSYFLFVDAAIVPDTMRAKTMTTQPRAALHIDSFGYAEIIRHDGQRIITTKLHEDSYVRADRGRETPQLFLGLRPMGRAITYSTPEQLARDIHAKLYTDRGEFERAAATLGYKG